jgi:hypothetical protein
VPDVLLVCLWDVNDLPDMEASPLMVEEPMEVLPLMLALGAVTGVVLTQGSAGLGILISMHCRTLAL